MNPFPLASWEGQLAPDRRTWRRQPWAGRDVEHGAGGVGSLTGVIATDGDGLVTVVRVAFSPDRWADVAVADLELCT